MINFIKKYLVLISTIFFLFNIKLNSVIILVHGTFAINQDWYKPNSDFYIELEQQAKLQNQNLVPFSWAAENNYKSRLTAAEILAKLILSYPENETIILIGHSHGGNVINLASQLLNDPMDQLMEDDDSETLYAELEELINAAYDTIVLGKTKSFILNFDLKTYLEHLEKLLPSNLRNDDYLENIKLIIQTYENINKEKSKKIHLKSPPPSKEYLIEDVFLLATPIDEDIYAPDMFIIKNVYNLYSSADLVQPVLGYYKRTLPKHERIRNLQATIKTKEKIINPSHSDFHDSTIAKSLLSIPDKIKDQNYCLDKVVFDKI